MSPILGIYASQDYVRIPPSSFESIATATPSSTNTITFSSIPSTYKHLQVRFIVNQSDQGSLRLRLNTNSSSSSYTEHILEGTGSAAQASGNGSGVVSGIFIVTCNDTTSTFSAGIVDIHDYSVSTKNKTIRNFAGYDRNGAGRIAISSGLYISTSVVTDLTFYVGGSNFTSGTTFSLYGIK